MNTHPAITAFLASLSSAERKEWRGRDVYAEREHAPPLSPGLFEKLESCCTAILGHVPPRGA